MHFAEHLVPNKIIMICTFECYLECYCMQLFCKRMYKGCSTSSDLYEHSGAPFKKDELKVNQIRMRLLPCGVLLLIAVSCGDFLLKVGVNLRTRERLQGTAHVMEYAYFIKFVYKFTALLRCCGVYASYPVGSH